jgi:hypothetical protein
LIWCDPVDFTGPKVNRTTRKTWFNKKKIKIIFFLIFR